MNVWIRPIVTALASAATVGATLTADGNLSVNDGFAMAAAGLTTLAADSLFKTREVRDLRTHMINRGIVPPPPD